MNHNFSTLSELNRLTNMLKGISESYNIITWKKDTRFKARS